MSTKNKFYSILLWTIGCYVLAHGILNIFWGNDPEFGLLLFLLAFLFFPPSFRIINNKFSIPKSDLLRFILALLIIWATLAVGAYNEGYGPFNSEELNEMSFDQKLWNEKRGSSYTFREKMLQDVVYNDTIRSLNQNQIIDLLGEPDRSKNEYYYYTISQKKIGVMPLHTRSMVIKFNNAGKIDWIKIHE